MDAAFKRFGEVRSHRKLVSSYHDSCAEDRKARERRQDGNHGRCLRRMPYLVLAITAANPPRSWFDAPCACAAGRAWRVLHIGEIDWRPTSWTTGS
jgi:hypothetical protein